PRISAADIKATTGGDASSLADGQSSDAVDAEPDVTADIQTGILPGYADFARSAIAITDIKCIRGRDRALIGDHEIRVIAAISADIVAVARKVRGLTEIPATGHLDRALGKIEQARFYLTR